MFQLADLGIQGAEAKVAMRDERAHAELVGQSHGFTVGNFSRLNFRRIAMRQDLTEQAQGIRLVAPFLVRTGMRQRTLGEGIRFLQAASQQLRLPQDETTACLDDSSFHGRRLFHCLCEQQYGVVDAPGQGVCRT